VPTKLEEVIQAWEGTVAMEVARATVMHPAEASAQEAVAAWESIVALVRDVVD
jgi:hypothetical protein